MSVCVSSVPPPVITVLVCVKFGETDDASGVGVLGLEIDEQVDDGEL